MSETEKVVSGNLEITVTKTIQRTRNDLEQERDVLLATKVSVQEQLNVINDAIAKNTARLGLLPS